MSDIIKDPIRAGQTPAKDTDDNKWLILTIVIVSIVFMLPFIFIMMMFGFIGRYIGDLPYIENEVDNSYRTSITLTEEQTKAIQSIWVIATDKELAAKGIGRTECWVLDTLAMQYDLANKGTSGRGWYDRDICEGETLTMNVGGNADGSRHVFRIKEDGKWAEFEFNGFDTLELYRFDDGNYSMFERGKVTYPLIDGSIDASKEEERPGPIHIPDSGDDETPVWSDAAS